MADFAIYEKLFSVEDHAAFKNDGLLLEQMRLVERRIRDWYPPESRRAAISVEFRDLPDWKYGSCFNFLPNDDQKRGLEGLRIILSQSLIDGSWTYPGSNVGPRIYALTAFAHEAIEPELHRQEVLKANPRPQFNLNPENVEEYRRVWHEIEADNRALEIVGLAIGAKFRFAGALRARIEISDRDYPLVGCSRF